MFNVHKFDLEYVKDLMAFLPRLSVSGMEVTQAIQYYKSASHLTDPSDQGADNTVKLAARKPAWVRVYVRSGLLGGDIPGVTGTLGISRRFHGAFYVHVTTLSPEAPGTVDATADPDYAVERGSLNNTLNFIIPAEQMCGSLSLVANISSPGGLVASMTINVSATLQQTLSLRGIMVGYNGPASSAPGAPNLTLAAPTLANLQTTSATTLLTFPVRSQATYSSAGTITWSQPLTDAPSCNGCCSPNWVALNAAVDAQRVADGNLPNVLYYGLMATGIPMGPIVGCNTGTVSTSSVGAGMTMAHELGHACGLPHAPCNTGGDPNYPAYEPYDPANTPTASTGEYGLDISNGNIMSPATFKDLMSYCGPRWISLYNYGRLTNNPDLNPVHVCVDYPWWKDLILYDELLLHEDWLREPPPVPPWRIHVMQPEPLIFVIGVLHSDDNLEVLNVMRVEATSRMPGARETGLTAELVGEKGEVLATAPLKRLQDHADGCGCSEGADKSGKNYPHLVQVFLKDVGPGAELLIRRGEKQLWNRRAPRKRPVITSFEVGLEGERLTAEWRMEASGEIEPQYWIQWSGDEGETWHALAGGLTGERAELEAGMLPGGKVAVRLFGSDGFFTAVSETKMIEVPEFPLAVSILTPRDGQTLAAGRSMRLWGTAQSDRPGDEVEPKALWILDGEELAEGLDAFHPAPGAGEHKLTLQVSIGDRRGEASIGFVTADIPTGPDDMDMKQYRQQG
ncbi:MAG TPA: hypothetical protein VMN57_01365 [Anaerolineales bacterium]|nr:hypothetical protein [Anaerolineales bacterium]